MKKLKVLKQDNEKFYPVTYANAVIYKDNDVDKTLDSFNDKIQNLNLKQNTLNDQFKDLKEIVSKLNQIDITKLQKFLNQLSFNSDEDIILGDYKHKMDIHVANDKSVDKVDEFWLNGVQLMKKILKDDEFEKLKMLLNMTTINNDSVTFNFGNNRKVDIYLRNDGIDDIWVNGHRIVNQDN